MANTWQANHPSRVEVANLAGGDVAICVSSAAPDGILSQVEDERIGFVAPLDSRSDLEWLLRGLSLHPNIRHVVLQGDAPTIDGEALLALWREGLDESGGVPGGRGVLSPELDASAVDRLRGHVELTDLREKPPGEVARSIRSLCREASAGAGAAARTAHALPDPVIPERKVFLSRKTTFPIFSSDVGDGWLQLLNLALRIGSDRRTADGQRIAEALNAVVTIETPILEDGEDVPEPEEFPAFLDFNRDDFDRCFFPGYQARLRERYGLDRLRAACDRLRASEEPDTAALGLFDSGDLGDADPATGLVSATFDAVEGRLFGSFVLRSTDVYTDWPLEASALVRVQREVASRLGLERGASTFVIHSAQLYERDFDRAGRVLQAHFKRPLPLHVDPSGVFLFGNDGGQARAMLLNHDASEIQWEQAFSDPEDLSWYIVDVMPWLLPQHIRYVGQECAALMRAMREKECYLQG